MKFVKSVSWICLWAFSIARPQVNFTSSNLPVIVIDTQGGIISDEPKITARMGIINNGPGQRNYITDKFNGYDGWIGIEIRGQSSQQFPKKQYALETRDSTGGNLDASLLGMPKENDWVLSAPYSDKSLMRNVLEYKLSNDIGKYASRTQYCELVLNGEYMGVYILMEKIKRNKTRVNIKKLEPEDSEGDALTGGYIFKIDKIEGAQTQGWYSAFPALPDGSKKIYYQYHYPDQDEITSVQKEYIRNYVGKFEGVMSLLSYDDPLWGYYDYVDIESFVDFYLLSEISKNVDAYRLSTFFHKNRDSEDGRLRMGPVWDFNLAFGNCDYDNASLASGWEVNYNNDSDWLSPLWAKKLFADPVFSNSFSGRWSALKTTVFKYENIEKFIDENVQLLAEAQERNFKRWPVLGQYVWPNYFVGNSYAEEIDYLKNWVKERLDWIDKNISGDYSDINWFNPDLSGFSLHGEKRALSVELFYNSTINVDSVVFKSAGDSLLISVASDSLFFDSKYSGNFTFRGVAYRDGKMVSVSPKYKIFSEITSVGSSDIPAAFELYQNYPNPFNPETTIKFSIPWNVETGHPAMAGQVAPSLRHVSLIVFDILGCEVATLVNGEKSPGDYSVKFDLAGLSAGIYLVVLRAGNYAATKKMVLLK